MVDYPQSSGPKGSRPQPAGSQTLGSSATTSATGMGGAQMTGSQTLGSPTAGSGMTSGMSMTVSAMFDSLDDAREAVQRLRELGLPQANVMLTQGAGAGLGASETESRGFFESLSDLFFPAEDRATYAEGLNRGGHLVTVSGLGEDNYEAAVDILDDEGAVDIDERSAAWRDEGWSMDSESQTGMASDVGMTGGETDSDAVGTGPGFVFAPPSDDRGSDDLGSGGRTGASGDDTLGLGTTGTGTSTSGTGTSGTGTAGMGTTGIGAAGLGGRMGGTASAATGDDEVIPVVEERLRVGKRDTSRGRVRVRAYVIEEPVQETVHLREQRVEVDRRPVDRALSPGDAAFQDRSIEAEEYREEAVVSKEARVVEEVGLRQVNRERDETISDTVRRTEVEVEDDRTEGEVTSDRSRTTDRGL